ncbi:MAG: YqfO family protein [Pseudomonadota bacterium]|nr:NGG1p interacting factor NIF3 [Pseudomonadales bacterium]MDY6921051.1 YqfO family protein [Pseudomonadota bacterium]
MYKLVFFVPETHRDAVKQAVFATGAGKIGDYDSCCWEVAGQGQFRPLAGANPFLGTTGRVESVSEYRVELVCEDDLIRVAIAAMKQAHPYEEPAYDVIRLESL